MLPPVRDGTGFSVTAVRVDNRGLKETRVAAVGSHGETLSDALLDRLASLRDTTRRRLDAQLAWLTRCLDELSAQQRELLELWCEWYSSNRKNSLAPSAASRAFLDA